MHKKPHLHDGTVTVDTDKNRLVEIPPSSCELPDIGNWDSVSASNASKGQQKNCPCAIGTHLNLNLLFVARNGVVLELCRAAASQNHHTCQFVDK